MRPATKVSISAILPAMALTWPVMAAVLLGAVLHAGWNALVKSSGDKPLDTALVERLAREHEVLITIEEGSVGGFGSFVLHHLALRGMLDHGLKIRPLCLPDRFIDHDSPKKQYDEAAEVARAGIKNAKGSAELHINLAYALQGKGEKDAAAKARPAKWKAAR